MVFITTATESYFAHTVQLAKSLALHEPDSVRVLCIVEQRSEVPRDVACWFDTVIFVEELGVRNLSAFLFKHNVTEACTAIKAHLFQYAMARLQREALFIFLDPDVTLYSGLAELDQVYSSGSILLTPHLLGQETSPDVTGPFIFRMMNAGIYNGGFIALRRSDDADAFLAWWSDKLLSYCYFDLLKGLFVDQKWLDFAHALFDPTVIRHPGYNLAYWNARGREVIPGTGGPMCNGQPVRFIHFSGFRNARSLDYLLKGGRPDHLRSLARDYLKRLEDCGRATYRYKIWSFGLFESGEVIFRDTQIVYRDHTKIQAAIPEPHKSSNDEINSAYDEIVSRNVR